jgi:hypothetical protein
MTTMIYRAKQFTTPCDVLSKLPRIDIQGEHKRSLHVQNDTENKCDVLKTSHLQQPTENSQHFVSNDPDDYCREPPLDVTSF